MGWHPAPPMSYETDYWESYLERDRSEMGEKLTKARIELVRRYCPCADVIDIGIGGGKFVKDSGSWGYDINETATKWLKSIGAFRNPYTSMVEGITCWDSLEHIPKPENLLKHVKTWLFVSLPIFDNVETILTSKHYKPGEHIWYFTHQGLVQWCRQLGFELIEQNNIESSLGREGIDSYVFKRLP